jgi:hypothetical protein
VASLGSFGRKHDKVELDFDYFGETIRVNPSCSQAALLEFMADAGSVDQADEVRSAQLIMRTMREVVHPDDFDLFWKLAKAERQDPVTEILPIAQAVIEAVTGFPTGQPSASGSGPATTRPSYVVDLPSQDIPTLDPITLQGIRLTEGRPDLQVAMLRAGEHRKVSA